MAGPRDEGIAEMFETEEEDSGNTDHEEEVSYQATQKDKEVHQSQEIPIPGTK